MDFIAGLGTNMSRFIFWGSSFLTEEQAPGLVSIGILGWLLISVLVVWLSASRKLTALRWLNTQVRGTKDEADFAANVLKITMEDDWIQDIEKLETELTSFTRPESPADVFSLRYGDFLSVDGEDKGWEVWSKVVVRRDIEEFLMKPWNGRGGQT